MACSLQVAISKSCSLKNLIFLEINFKSESWKKHRSIFSLVINKAHDPIHYIMKYASAYVQNDLLLYFV